MCVEAQSTDSARMLARRPSARFAPRRKWPRARLDMSVCAGFLCSDGVMIGADTEKSGGMKYFASKVRREPFAAGEYTITGTGEVSFLGMTSDIIKAALYSKNERFKAAKNLDEKTFIFHSSVRGVINQVQKHHKESIAYNDKPEYLELILGVHFQGKDEGLKLMYCAGNSTVTWIDHHITAGSGADIAMRFLTILSPGPCPME